MELPERRLARETALLHRPDVAVLLEQVRERVDKLDLKSTLGVSCSVVVETHGTAGLPIDTGCRSA